MWKYNVLKIDMGCKLLQVGMIIHVGISGDPPRYNNYIEVTISKIYPSVWVGPGCIRCGADIGISVVPRPERGIHGYHPIRIRESHCILCNKYPGDCNVEV